MTIKKSSLEGRWYYRVAKVFFLILPLLILFFLLLSILLGKRIVACSIVQSNFSEFPLDYFVFIAIGLALYYVLLKWIWKGFLYIAFGGVEDDMKKDYARAIPVKPERNKAAQAIPLIITLILLALMFLSAMGYITLPKIDLNALPQIDSDFVNPPNAGPTVTCPATSAQTATPCGSVSNGVGVSGVIVHDSCRCPSDTNYSGTTDVVTPGGPYKICTCN